MSLFRQFILRHLLRERLRTCVTTFGIAIGVAVVIAIQLTNASSVHGFEAAIETVSGKTSLEITGPGLGLDEMALADMDWLRQYGQVSPVINGVVFAKVPGGANETLSVLGVDVLHDRSFRDYNILEFAEKRREPSPQEFLSLLIDPHSIIITEKFASKYGLAVGQSLNLTIGDHVRPFVIRGLLRNQGPARTLDGNFALMDIAAAQWAFDRLGRLDRVDVLLRDGVNINTAEQEISRRLKPGLLVQRPARRGQQVEKMVEAFQFNLSALSYIALLVGLFLIYNTVSTSVIARREEIGTLRALGATKRILAGLFLSEALAFAVVGSTAGLILGRLMSFGAVRITTTTVKALYIATAAAPPQLELRHVAVAFGIALPLAFIAAIVPALEASRVSPTTAIRGSGRIELRFRLRYFYLLIPALLFTLALAFSQMGPVNGLPIFGYGASILIVFGAAFLVPTVLYLVSRFTTALLTKLFGVEGRLAIGNLSGAISRISISVAALAVSLSMMVAIAVLIGSFRDTVIYWVGQTLQADLFMRPATRTNIAVDATFSPEVEKLVSEVPGIEAIDQYRNFDIPYQGGLITLGSGNFSSVIQRNYLLFKSPSNWQSVLRESAGKDDAIISESLAIKHNLRVGDSITVLTPKGDSSFRIIAIYYDYASDRGVVILDRAVFNRFFGEQQPTSLNLYLRKGADPDAARDEILAKLGDNYKVLIYTNTALRREILRIFDSTFAITYALEAIAILIAIVGIASTLLALILERRKEISVLRLIGADRRQIRKMTVIEAAILGGVSQCIGIGVGLLLSLVLIYVVNVQSFGWTIQFHIPVWFLVQSTVLILVATALAGVYPANRAAMLKMAAQEEE
ncbi:MAG TPA: FtsX-like permease family protein [Blastocatellia bacterium]|nr:FtsX-like permease family protein [Blastocatellia bacterium]